MHVRTFSETITLDASKQFGRDSERALRRVFTEKALDRFCRQHAFSAVSVWFRTVDLLLVSRGSNRMDDILHSGDPLATVSSSVERASANERAPDHGELRERGYVLGDRESGQDSRQSHRVDMQTFRFRVIYFICLDEETAEFGTKAANALDVIRMQLGLRCREPQFFPYCTLLVTATVFILTAAEQCFRLCC